MTGNYAPRGPMSTPAAKAPRCQGGSGPWRQRGRQAADLGAVGPLGLVRT